MNIKRLATDSDAQENGKWFDYELGTRLRIRHAGYKPFQRRYQELLFESNQQFQAQYAADRAEDPSLPETVNLPQEYQDLCRLQAAMEELLVDWDGFDDGEKPVICSEEKEALFENPDYRDLFADVLMTALDKQRFRRYSTTDIEGKPEPSTNGS